MKWVDIMVMVNLTEEEVDWIEAKLDAGSDSDNYPNRDNLLKKMHKAEQQILNRKKGSLIEEKK